MNKILGGGRIAIAILLFFLYVGYQFYERKKDADALQEETLEAAVSTVSVVRAMPGNRSAPLRYPVLLMPGIRRRFTHRSPAM